MYNRARIAGQPGAEKIRSLQRQWKAQSILYCLLLALSASLLLTILLYGWLRWSPWNGLAILVILFPVVLLLFPTWRITCPDVTRLLDKVLPELEESCGLLLRPAGSLGPLEKLQATRTEARLVRARLPRPLRKKLNSAFLLLAGVIVVCLLLAAARHRPSTHAETATHLTSGTPAAGLPEKAAPSIRSVNVRIVPPAYTGRSLRQQQEFNLRVEQGSLLNWELQTAGRVDTLQFIFNDTARRSLHAANEGRTQWRLSIPVTNPGFYQVDVDGQLSALYKIEVIADEPPHILIRTPKSYTVVDFGESRRIPLEVNIRDDYGVADAFVMAMIASGSGEAVKFKEQEFRFDRPFTGAQATYEGRATIDLAALGLQPGDELYFYCLATDNHGQTSRTDMYIISLPDTARLLSLEGLTTGADVKPEYFRSERQIILETEQLLKEKDTISTASFTARSNDLGIDQKLLRLRYGKFLGEEAEEVMPGSGGPGDLDKVGNFSNAAKVLDAYTDKHDNSEDATYFEAAIKEQLKATLTEMWGAELRLRTFKPQEALPYAYKALRLLKDLQQKSRAYVAKTGVRVTPLDPAKRLTGKLEDIGHPMQLKRATDGPRPDDILRISLGLLEQMGQQSIATGRDTVSMNHMAVITRAGTVVLQQAMRSLAAQATANPAEYLSGYQALRRILGSETTKKTDLLSAQQALRRMLPDAEALPSPDKVPADAGLSRLYFDHLNEPGRKQ